MKFILTIISVITLCFGAMADEVMLIKVHLTNGTTEAYNLPDKPVMRFDGDKMLMESEIMQGEYARADVEKITTERGERQSSLAEVADADFVFSYDGKVVKSTAESMTIYDLNGAMLITGKNAIDISGLSSGVYIVAPANHPAIKIIIK